VTTEDIQWSVVSDQDNMTRGQSTVSNAITSEHYDSQHRVTYNVLVGR